MGGVDDEARVLISFGEAEGGSVFVGPLRLDEQESSLVLSSPRILFGPISVIGQDGIERVRYSANGIEPLGLSRLREDLRTLQRERRGHVDLGEHDWYQVVEFIASDGDAVEVRANLPDHKEWNVAVGTIRLDDLDAIIEQIDAVGTAFGPLVGHCVCGAPSLTYYRI